MSAMKFSIDHQETAFIYSGALIHGTKELLAGSSICWSISVSLDTEKRLWTIVLARPRTVSGSKKPIYTSVRVENKYQVVKNWQVSSEPLSVVTTVKRHWNAKDTMKGSQHDWQWFKVIVTTRSSKESEEETDEESLPMSTGIQTPTLYAPLPRSDSLNKLDKLDQLDKLEKLDRLELLNNLQKLDRLDALERSLERLANSVATQQVHINSNGQSTQHLHQQVATAVEQNDMLCRALDGVLSPHPDDLIEFQFPDDQQTKETLFASTVVLSKSEVLTALVSKLGGVNSGNETEDVGKKWLKISIDGFRRSIFKAMLFFLVTGTVVRPKEKKTGGFVGGNDKTNATNTPSPEARVSETRHFQDLFVMSDCYRIQGLKIICRDQLLRALTVTNAVEFLFDFAMCYEEIKAPVVEFIVRGYGQIFAAAKDEDPFGPYMARRECRPMVKELMRLSAASGRGG